MIYYYYYIYLYFIFNFFCIFPLHPPRAISLLIFHGLVLFLVFTGGLPCLRERRSGRSRGVGRPAEPAGPGRATSDTLTGG